MASPSLFEKAIDLRAPESHVTAQADRGKLTQVAVHPNLERLHGSRPEHADKKIAKVTLARDHVMSINPSCEVHAFLGELPQKEIVDAVVCADLALGCTDQQHSRLALSDLAVRYLVPSPGGRRRARHRSNCPDHAFLGCRSLRPLPPHYRILAGSTGAHERFGTRPTSGSGQAGSRARRG